MCTVCVYKIFLFRFYRFFIFYILGFLFEIDTFNIHGLIMATEEKLVFKLYKKEKNIKW